MNKAIFISLFLFLILFSNSVLAYDQNWINLPDWGRMDNASALGVNWPFASFNETCFSRTWYSTFSAGSASFQGVWVFESFPNCTNHGLTGGFGYWGGMWTYNDTNLRNANVTLIFYFNNTTGWGTTPSLDIYDINTTTSIASEPIVPGVNDWQSVALVNQNLSYNKMYWLKILNMYTFNLKPMKFAVASVVMNSSYPNYQNITTVREPNANCFYHSGYIYHFPYYNQSTGYSWNFTKDVQDHIGDFSDVSQIWVRDSGAGNWSGDWRVWKYDQPELTPQYNISAGEPFFILTKSGLSYTLNNCTDRSCGTYQSSEWYTYPFSNTSIPDEMQGYIANWEDVALISAWNGTAYKSYVPSSYQTLYYLIKNQPYFITTDSGNNYTFGTIDQYYGAMCNSSDTTGQGYYYYLNDSSTANICLLGLHRSYCSGSKICVSHTASFGIECFDEDKCIHSYCINSTGWAVSCSLFTNSTFPTLCKINGQCVDCPPNNTQLVSCDPNLNPMNYLALIMGSAFGYSDCATQLAEAQVISSIIITFIISISIISVLAYLTTINGKILGQIFIFGALLFLVMFTYMGWFPSWLIILLIVFTAVYIVKVSLNVFT